MGVCNFLFSLNFMCQLRLLTAIMVCAWCRCIIFPKSDKQQRAHFMGEFVKGSMQGLGVLTFHKGARYEGQFADNLVRINFRSMRFSFCWPICWCSCLQELNL